MVRVVLELCGWGLVEGEEGGPRVWINTETNEARGEDDPPPEVLAELTHSADGAAQEHDSGAGGEAIPGNAFPRERGGDSLTHDSETSCQAAPSVPFRRARGLNVVPSAASAIVEPFVPGADAAAAANAVAALEGCPSHEADASQDARPGASLPQCAAERSPPQWPDEQRENTGDVMALPPAHRRSVSYFEEDPDELVPVMPLDLADAPVREPTIAMLGKATTLRANHGEPVARLLQRVTHLHMAEKGLTVLGQCVGSACPNLKVMYLSDNHIHTIAPLRSSIRQLHLQGNDIWEISSWSQHLPNLELLDLRENRLAILTGLKDCTALRELLLGGQRTGTALQFGKRFLHEVAPSVETLDVARNQLTDLRCLAFFERLGKLDASSNLLASIDALTPALALPYLQSARFEENPVCRIVPKFRDEVILLASRLIEFDGREIKSHERQFLHELDRRRRSAGRSSVRRARSGSRGPRGVSAEVRRALGYDCGSAVPCGDGGSNGGYAGGQAHRLPPIPPSGHARPGDLSPCSQAVGAQPAHRRQRSHDRLTK